MSKAINKLIYHYYWTVLVLFLYEIVLHNTSNNFLLTTAQFNVYISVFCVICNLGCYILKIEFKNK